MLRTSRSGTSRPPTKVSESFRGVDSYSWRKVSLPPWWRSGIVYRMSDVSGKFLIASSGLNDANFVRSVVLIIQHGNDGALGLVVNQPTQASVREACKVALQLDVATEGVIHRGGPCDGPLMVVHTAESAADLTVMPGVFFTTRRDKIEWLLLHAQENVRFFIGHSGWAPGQLEQELATGSWLIADASAEQIFSDDPRQWPRLIQSATIGKWVQPEQIPDDPSLN